MKRVADFAVAASGLMVLAPLLALLALVVRSTSPGPALFRQVRVGMSGRPFTIYKFRTMFVRAQADSSITTWRDARITPVGSVLRRTKLDELPQLVNVLLGDMSLVGPRPEVPDMVRLWDQESRAIILSVRPGITDPASLLFLHEDELLGNGPNATKIYVERVMPEKLRIYRAYVAARSPSGDVRIVLATIGTLLCPGRADT